MAEAAVAMHVNLREGVSPKDDLAILSDFVVPLAKAQAGFKNGTWARDGKGGVGVIISDAAENAAAAQDVLKPPAGQGPELISNDLYEVGAQA